MKKLLILNGVMGSGKSTFIKENHLEDFVLSSDELRIKMAGFDMSENGLVISQKKDRQVWSTLYTILETRMEMGLFTVVDAMHLRTRDFKKYKELADLYGYGIYVKRFDVTIDELLQRNAERESYKQIPENVITKKYEVFTNQILPDYVTIINSVDELYPVPDGLDAYENIYCVGDIHNNADKLEIVYNEVKENQNSLYIFTGDIFDRGSKPYETMLLVGELLTLNNEQRNKMFNNKSLSLEEISELIKKLPNPKKRKFTLNFAVTGENDLDVEKMNKLFDKDRCIVKITPIHETVEAVKNGYEIVHTFDVYEKYEKPLVEAGWDVIVFVPSQEEDEDRITCGNSLIALEHKKKEVNR